MLYLGWTVALFTLATITNACEAWSIIQQQRIYFEAVRNKAYDELLQYLFGTTLKTVPNTLLNIGSNVINFVADTMLIHRCWIIWGSRKRVAFPLIIMSLGTNVLGLVSYIMWSIGVGDTTVDSNRVLLDKANTLNLGYSIANVIVNSIITLTTAGGIWWISRQARKEMGRTIDQKYKTIVAIILESGVLYPLAIIVQVTVGYTVDPDASGAVPVDLGPVVWQAAGIAPTLIIVRAAMGKSVDSVHQQVSTLRFAAGAQDAQASQLCTINFGEDFPEVDRGSGLGPSRQTQSAVEVEKVA
ncbi:hypothetical protein VNI00_013060 [Paramarasmius palmivorus]|uniref:Uncharacterized protein n=1 Tax=Paramarasmius palmivorus TaxID=297713 RepID=A0AAW0C1G2_9AGAR